MSDHDRTQGGRPAGVATSVGLAMTRRALWIVCLVGVGGMMQLLSIGAVWAAQPDPVPAATEQPYIESWKVSARSLLLPGWGQFHLGESGAGQAYLAGALVGMALAFEVVSMTDRDNSRRTMKALGWGLYGVSAVLSASAAWQSAERRNRENGWELSASSAPDGSAALRLRRSF